MTLYDLWLTFWLVVFICIGIYAAIDLLNVIVAYFNGDIK